MGIHVCQSHNPDILLQAMLKQVNQPTENLFGVLKAGDTGLPDYKLKQGETFSNLKIEKFYMDNFSKVLDEYLENEDIIDLRAGFYEKFYKIEKPYTTMKFIKDGKVVSHWAKAYRGIILKLLALTSWQC